MKILIYIAAFLLLLLAEGCGAWVKRILGISRNGYHAPVGFAFLFSVSQLLYYPAELLDLPMKWVILVTMIVLITALVFLMYDLQDVYHAWFRKESLVILGIVLLFILINHNTTYLGNAIEPTFSAMPLSSFQAPKFQGYYYFTLGFSWILERLCSISSAMPMLSDSAIRIYGFGILYAVTSSMVILDILRSFKLRNHWFEFALGSYLFLNGNYTAWLKGSAWIGLSWSILFVTLSVSDCYLYVKESNEQRKYLLIPLFGAGLACDNSFGLSGLAILLGLMIYLFSIRKIRSLFDFSTLIIPHVLYVAAVVTKYSFIASFAIIVFYIIFFFRRYKRPIRRWIARSEEFFFEYWKEVFLIGLPVLLAIGSVIVFIMQKGRGLTSYLYYFSDFSEIDGVRDYIFIHSDILQIIINLFRWGGLVSLIWLAKEPEDQSVRILMISLLLIFLNPLATPVISYMTGPMFFHSFHVLFNPFTEAIMFVYFYRMFQWNVIGQWVLEIVLCFGALIGLAGIL